MDYDEKTTCPTCKTESLKMVTVDEGDMATCWCENCGTLTQGFTDSDQEIEIPKMMGAV